jgi:hypothetical protein
MPEAYILANLEKIITYEKTIWGIKQKKIWHFKQRRIKHLAAAQARCSRWDLNFLCRI